MDREKVFAMPFGKPYSCLVAKAERKGRTGAEVDTLIEWMTGYSPDAIQSAVSAGTAYGNFFREAPNPNPARMNVRGSICGIRVEEIEDSTMRDIRILDKMVDELAKGKTMDKILRKV